MAMVVVTVDVCVVQYPSWRDYHNAQGLITAAITHGQLLHHAIANCVESIGSPG